MTSTRLPARAATCIALAAAMGACGPSSGESTGRSAAQVQPSTGTITDATGLCVDVQWANTASGTPIQLWTCNGTGAQQWTYESGSFVGLAGKCLDVQGGQTANGTAVQLWDCNGTAAQQWTMKNGQLVGVGGKCLDVPGSHSVPGQTLQIWDCNGGSNQQFSFSGESAGGGGSCGGGVASDGGSPGSSSGGGSSGSSSGGTGTNADGGKPGMPTAQAFVAGLGMGVDIERARITYMTYQGKVIGQSTDYFDYLKANGVDHVRIFFPWSPSFLNGGIGVGAGVVPPTSGTFDAMLQGALNANKAGLKVFLDLMDLTQLSDCQGSSLAVVQSWLTAAAKDIAGYGFDPSMIAVGPINEPEGGTNADWDPVLSNLHDLLRQSLPASDGWILTSGGAYWDDPGTFAQGRAILADPNVIYMVHYYPAATPPNNGDAAVVKEWAGVAQEVASYAAAHGGVPVVLGESGLWNSNDLPYGGAPDPGQGAWAAAIQDTAQGAGALRPMPWAVTDGSEPVSSGGAEATLPSGVASAFQSATAFIRSQSYYSP